MVEEDRCEKSNEDFSKHGRRVLSDCNINNSRNEQRKKQKNRPSREAEFREEDGKKNNEGQVTYVGFERFFKKNVRRNEDGNENGNNCKPSKHLLVRFRSLVWVVRICLLDE